MDQGMSLFENDDYQWRETYFILFDEAGPAIGRTDWNRHCDSLDPRYVVRDVRADDKGRFESLTLVAHRRLFGHGHFARSRRGSGRANRRVNERVAAERDVGPRKAANSPAQIATAAAMTSITSNNWFSSAATMTVTSDGR